MKINFTSYIAYLHFQTKQSIIPGAHLLLRKEPERSSENQLRLLRL